MQRPFLIPSVLTLALGASAHLARADDARRHVTPAQEPIVYCAHDVAGIQFSLTVAEDNALDDDIRLVAGTYQPATLLSTTMQEANSLEISGGWNVDCSQKTGGQTILDGQSQTPLLDLRSQQVGDLVVSDLTFVNAAGAALVVNSAGLALAQRNIFLANHAISNVATMRLVGGQGSAAFNNLVVANENNGASVYLGCGASADSGVFAAGNTVVNNIATTPGAIGGVTVYCPSGSSYVVNNLLWNNGGDLNLFAPAGVATLAYNDIGLQVGSMAGPDSTGNFSTAPIFAPGLLNFHLASSSATINRGTNCIGMACGDVFGVTDLAGVPRIQGQRIDIGAYESDVLLYGDFEPMR